MMQVSVINQSKDQLSYSGSSGGTANEQSNANPAALCCFQMYVKELRVSSHSFKGNREV